MFTSSSRPQSASSARRREELPLGHGRVGEADVGAGVLQHERPFQEFLHGADAVGDVGQRLLVERHGQQVVGVEAGHAGPAQVVGNPAGLDGVGQALELVEVVEVERIGAADRQRDAVHDDGVALGDLFEDVARPAAGVHEVFGDDLEPVHRRVVVEDVRKVDGAQADAEAEVGDVPDAAGSWHQLPG